jgi:hypothetical protein
MGKMPDSAVIVLCIVGAGAALLIGWAIGHRVYQGNEGSGSGSHMEQGFSQYEYM